MGGGANKVTFLALVCGGRGPNTWDEEIEVSGEGMTIRQALDALEKQLDRIDCAVVSIEQTS